MKNEINSESDSDNLVQMPSWPRRIIKKYWSQLFLLVVITIGALWYESSIKNMESEFASRELATHQAYELKIDSITLANMERTTTVFSWAVRSEMIRDNMEQVDQFFFTYIKDSQVMNIKLIDPKTAEILLSTNKKEEGEKELDEGVLKTERLVTVRNENTVLVKNPIMGLDKVLGILVIEMDI